MDPGEPLFLTPLIKAGEIEKAKNESRVQDLYPEIVSHSGFITVNEEYNSNIFFWFFPCKDDSENAPVILWNDGGMGLSAFFGLFAQNGPFNGNGTDITLNQFSWHNKYNMIYMDNPVETGFSFTDKPEGYITSGAGAAGSIYAFLQQFFKLFPNLQTNKFYNAGASYGATYATNVAHYIHEKNQDSPEIKINLAGLILDSPWIDPYSQTEYGFFLFNVGLINQKTCDEYIAKENQIRHFLDQENFVDAGKIWTEVTQNDTTTHTGYGAINHICNDQPVFKNVTPFVELPSTRKALHVGSRKFQFINQDQHSRMQPNFMRSAKPKLETLLEEGYSMLLYVGNLDGITGHLGVQNLLVSLQWEGANELVHGSRRIWKVNGSVAGYVTSSHNATFILVRNAGHGCLGDQPEWILDAVQKFTGGSTQWFLM